MAEHVTIEAAMEQPAGLAVNERFVGCPRSQGRPRQLHIVLEVDEARRDAPLVAAAAKELEVRHSSQRVRAKKWRVQRPSSVVRA